MIPGQGQPSSSSSTGIGGLSGLNLGGIGGAGGIGGVGVGAQNGLGAGLGANIGTGQLVLGGLGTLGNLWTAWNANQLAQQSFAFNKTLASQNYANQAQSYNTNLTGMESARASMENLTPAQVSAYDSANSLKTTLN